jgi:PAS domain S-box-containing protein
MADPHRTARAPRQFGAGWLTLAGAALAALVLAAVGGLAVYERNEAIEAQIDHDELLARVLEDHATRSFETASLALSALADALAKEPAGRNTQIGMALTQALAGLPLLRGVAVLDANGQVLASSAEADIGRVIDLGRLGPLPTVGHDSIGAFVRGRGLLALAAGAGSPVTPAGVGFIPMLRNVETLSGRGLLLVGLVNPDALANHQQQTLDDADAAAVLADLQGQVLAATASAPVGPGDRIVDQRFWSALLSQADHGSRIGAGLRPGRQIVAFRALRNRPLAVLVEHRESAVLAAWWRNTRWLFAVAAAATLVIAAMTLVAARSLRAREAARRQRDAAQHAVALRERELSAIVTSVQELIFRTDAGGTLTFVNARWQITSDRPLESLIGRGLTELVHPRSQDAAQALFADGGGALRSAQVLMGSGSPRQFDMAVSPLLEDGHVVGFAGSAIDVTDRLAAQAQVQEQLAFSALLLDTMPLPVSMLDRDHRYVTVNRAWEDFTGQRRDEVIGRHARDRVRTGEDAMHQRHDTAVLAHGGRVRYEADATRRDGSRRSLAITKAAVPGADGLASGVLVTFMDISEIRAAERMTREARDAAEEASRSKSAFIANISHELRTPLQSIIGFSELGMVRGRAHEKLAGMFTDIHASGERMLALVNDLLDVSKLDNTVGSFRFERTDVRPLVREVVGELAPLLAARRLHVELALGEGQVVARVDPLRFQQVVRNVLANAMKFSPPGAAIELRGDVNHENGVEIEVRDHGPGIPPAELDTIFEAFVRSSATKDGTGGTGLGLAICRQIASAHGGSIVAANAEGGGSRFTLTLPAREFADSPV